MAFAFGASFPTLKGRVTDDANLLSSKTKEILTQKIKAAENESHIYLVVATVNSLEGEKISDYGVKLGRHWGIGEKGKDNGVLLLIAPNERRVNISTGYGLEGVLTDAISSHIIQNKILPEFKLDNYEGGILNGVDSIILALSGEYNTLQIMRNYLKDFTIIQIPYPQESSFELGDYSPREIFVTLFILSFLLMMITPMLKSKLPFVASGFSTVFTFVAMIASFVMGDFLTNGANYVLIALYIAFVGFFSYKFRDYNPE